MEPPKPPWYTELENAVKPLTSPETVDQKAIRLLNEQLNQLANIRGLSCDDPQFTAWHNSTVSLLRRFLSQTSPHLQGFIDIGFWIHIFPAPPGHERKLYVDGCRTADASLRAVIREIENFGVHEEHPKKQSTAQGGGMQQNFYGNVTIQSQAIATDNAIQSIGQMGDAIGSNLREIAELFKQSGELKQREIKEGLAGIQGVAVEIQKPEAKRDWRKVLDSGQVVLTIADKATDLVHKLGPYLPAILTLMENAKHWVK